MTRWEPDARGRLRQAALELFTERGYDVTTVEDIATRAGVTKRTYFRHFPDKREVLFGNADAFQQLFVDALAQAPPGAGLLEAVTGALEAVGATFAGRQEASRLRQRVVASTAELRERELSKLAAVAAAMAAVLRERGAPEPAASVAAQTGVAVFRTAFERWVTAKDGLELVDALHESLAALQQFTAR